MLYQVDPAFETFAKSMAGINGGNPNGPLWFCGIEFGRDRERETSLDWPAFVEDGMPCWNQAFVEHHAATITKWPYMQKLAKVALAFEGRNVPYREYMRHELLRSDKSTFHLNLFPIAFPDTDAWRWQDQERALTGLPSRKCYEAWCVQHRFPILRALLRKHVPSVLICTGSNYESEFRMAFLDETSWFEAGEEVPMAAKRVKRFRANGGRTTMLITPFFGQGGVMADADLAAIAAIARGGPR